ncbi:MAG TPA: HAMP domain-containing histidine kinase [Caldithrix abyssi]|uniref:histidine kinase n=1 Tax=Caldithrix abyssi TaxID=187145 RepID=A0A7V5RPF8_CALAY|nr:HAMP domain-containing histidine kinase [Caldithrix abyssi]
MLFRERKPFSLKSRIITGFSSLTFLVVVVLSFVSYRTARDIYSDQIKEQMRQIAVLMGKGMDGRFLPLLRAGKRDAASEYYESYLKKKALEVGLNSAFLFDNRYRILATSDSSAGRLFLELNRYELQQLEPGHAVTSLLFKGHDQKWYLWSFYRLSANCFLGLGEDAARLSYLDQLLRYFIMIGMGGLLLTVILARWIARQIGAPIQKLVEFSRHLGDGDFSKKAPRDIYGELTVLRDTMEQMRLDLSEQHREREQLLAQIAHEIRNPLGGIELLAGLIQEENTDNTSTRQKAGTILRETSELKKYIASFIELNKPLEPQPEFVDPIVILSEVKNSLREMFTEKNICWQSEIKPVRIFFDRSHLRQILFNLVKNALEAVEQEGRVLVRGNFARGKYVLQVSDSGPGVTGEIRTNLFKPFFTTKVNGSGLGLAFSKKLCTLNGALLYLESTRALTTFSIEIPKNGVQNEPRG